VEVVISLLLVLLLHLVEERFDRLYGQENIFLLSENETSPGLISILLIVVGQKR